MADSLPAQNSMIIKKYYGQGNDLVQVNDVHKQTCAEKLVQYQILIQNRHLKSNQEER